MLWDLCYRPLRSARVLRLPVLFPAVFTCVGFDGTEEHGVWELLPPML